MRFHKSIELNGSIDEVHALLLNPEFRQEVATDAGAEHVSVTVDEPTSDVVVAAIETRQPTDGMSALATTFLGSELVIRQTERWTSPTTATMTVRLPGKPGGVDGAVRLLERGDVTVQSVEAEVTVKIPLIGGKVEKMIGSVVEKVLDLQEQRGNQRLSD